MSASSLSTAERSLWAAGVALLIVAALVRSAQRDLGKAKRELRAERNARVDLEDRVDKLAGQLDGALETIHRLQTDPPATPAAE